MRDHVGVTAYLEQFAHFQAQLLLPPHLVDRARFPLIKTDPHQRELYPRLPCFGLLVPPHQHLQILVLFPQILQSLDLLPDCLLLLRYEAISLWAFFRGDGRNLGFDLIFYFALQKHFLPIFLQQPCSNQHVEGVIHSPPDVLLLPVGERTLATLLREVLEQLRGDFLVSCTFEFEYDFVDML